MPWTCKLIEWEDDKYSRWGENRMPVGALWYDPLLLDKQNGPEGTYKKLAPNYYRDWNGKRPPLWICLPGGNWWCVDTLPVPSLQGDGWKVTGAVPCITVSPSINFEGGYHGWIRDGVVTDDCEGRRFTPEGVLEV